MKIEGCLSYFQRVPLQESCKASSRLSFPPTLSTLGKAGVSVVCGSSYPFNHASMGSFLESCRGVQLTLSLVDKRTVTGKMLMVERAKRAIEGCKESEEYVAAVHLFEEQWGIIHKVRFEEIAQVSMVDTIMQEELSKSLTTALANQMPKPPPPPKDSREAISIRARGDTTGESLCRASYVAACPG